MGRTYLDKTTNMETNQNLQVDHIGGLRHLKGQTLNLQSTQQDLDPL